MMKNKMVWWLLLGIGIVPFVFPFLNFAYAKMVSTSWTLVDWLVMYSFIYWPTYILGFILIIISVIKLKK